MAVHERKSDGKPESTALVSFTGTANVSGGEQTFTCTCSTGCSLAASTSYFVVVHSIDNYSVDHVADHRERRADAVADRQRLDHRGRGAR